MSEFAKQIIAFVASIFLCAVISLSVLPKTIEITVVDNISIARRLERQIEKNGANFTYFSASIKADLDSNGIKERIEINSQRNSVLRIWQGKKLRWEGIPKSWKPWKLKVADIDGDGKLEIALGIIKPTKFFPKPHNCLFTYSWTGSSVVPKWLGSSLSRTFTDFMFANLDGIAGDELIALENSLKRKKSVGIYKWNSFGFTLERRLGDWNSAKLLSVENGQILIEADGERRKL